MKKIGIVGILIALLFSCTWNEKEKVLIPEFININEEGKTLNISTDRNKIMEIRYILTAPIFLGWSDEYVEVGESVSKTILGHSVEIAAQKDGGTIILTGKFAEPTDFFIIKIYPDKSISYKQELTVNIELEGDNISAVCYCGFEGTMTDNGYSGIGQLQFWQDGTVSVIDYKTKSLLNWFGTYCYKYISPDIDISPFDNLATYREVIESFVPDQEYACLVYNDGEYKQCWDKTEADEIWSQH